MVTNTTTTINWDEIRKAMESQKVPDANNISISGYYGRQCPSCGHCPTCGRGNQWAYPYWSPPIWYFGGTIC